MTENGEELEEERRREREIKWKYLLVTMAIAVVISNSNKGNGCRSGNEGLTFVVTVVKDDTTKAQTTKEELT